MRTLTTDQWERVDSLIERLEILPEPKREAALRAAQSEGREEPDVLALVALHFRLPPEPGVKHARENVPGFTILEEIGSGGMGTVYRAAQEDLARVVALKLTKPGIASRAALRRFEHEAATLALLNHVNIAHVYVARTRDAGEGPEPYFAMEYIENARDLISYADAKRLSIRQRLELFTKICDGVHHAHQKAVIHRDLKPANILVGDSGEPKIIDFGIAGATDADVPATHGRPRVDRFLSLPWASPEQVQGLASQLDVCTDVYSLGVVLYELLAGALPFDLPASGAVDISELKRRICEGQPPPPSERVRAAAPAGNYDPSLAARNRGLARRRLARELSGELDAIVLKALEKNPAKRFQSTPELAENVKCYLTGQTVPVAPGGRLYQFRKLVGRHQLVAALIFGLFVSLVSFSFVLRSELIRVKTAESTTDTLIRLLLAERHRAYGHMLEVRNAELTLGFAGELARQASLPDLRPPQSSFDDVLDLASARVEIELAAQPQAEANVRDLLGLIYACRQRYDRAEDQFRRALAIRRELLVTQRLEPSSADEHLPGDLAATLENLGCVLLQQGDLHAAEGPLRECLAIRRAALDPEDWHTGQAEFLLGACLAGQIQPGDEGSVESASSDAMCLLLEGTELLERTRGAAHPTAQAARHRLRELTGPE